MSLPTRERELKRVQFEWRMGGTASLPTRERELKLEKDETWVKDKSRSLHGSVN